MNQHGWQEAMGGQFVCRMLMSLMKYEEVYLEACDSTAIECLPQIEVGQHQAIAMLSGVGVPCLDHRGEGEEDRFSTVEQMDEPLFSRATFARDSSSMGL